MAVLDPDRGVVVVRLVYDGPPLAGKTTSVRALARSLARRVDTPLEAAGRTMFFDWMEYTGGLFEGHQIRCQIVSVPGQTNLAPRRKSLLLSADAVVFVADTGDKDAVLRSGEYVAALSRLMHHADPPVGVVVQANKRDLPSAVPLDELRGLLGSALSGIAITESVAHEGVGIRETFVLAVRLALDRVRELIASGRLPRGRPEVDSAGELLAALESNSPIVPEPTRAEDEPPATVRPPAPSSRTFANGVRPGAPRLPDSRVPSGAIWPAVDGRMFLHEATATNLKLYRGDGDAWIAGIGTGWRIHSAIGAWFSGLDRGRDAVLGWARIHAARVDFLSPGRCIVVAEAGDDGWRLWQIVRAAPSLRDWLLELADGDPTKLLEAIYVAARTLVDAMTSGKASGLVATLDTVGLGEHGPQFVGLMPGPSVALERIDSGPAIEHAADSAVRQLEVVLHGELSGSLDSLRRVLDRGRAAPAGDWGKRIAAVIG